MKIIRYGVGAVIGAVLATGLWACSAPAEAESKNDGRGGMYTDTWHKMPDGRTVYCLYLKEYDTGYASGPISFECDFANASVHAP